MSRKITARFFSDVARLLWGRMGWWVYVIALCSKDQSEGDKKNFALAQSWFI
jgi:hypothetical protein